MNECIFCRIVKKKMSAKTIAERKNFIVIEDIAPKAPLHFLLISRKHLESLLAMEQADQGLLGEMIYETKILAKKYGLAKNGYRVVINCGPAAGQVVPHLHAHFLAGKKLTF